MEGIRLWATSLAVSSLLIAAVGMLIPKGSTEKVLKALISLVFLIIMLSPLINGKVKIDIDEISSEFKLSDNREDTERIIESQMTETVKQAVGKEVEEYLESKSVLPEKINIDASKNNEGYLVVTKISVFIAKEQETFEIGKELEEKYNCEVEILSSEE